MTDAIYEYGKIFVDTDVDAVSASIEALLGVPRTGSLWIQDGVEVEVRRNPDVGSAADFVGWPAVIEVAPEGADTDGDRVLAVVQTVVVGLRARGGTAVLAADYEALITTAPAE